MIKIAYKISHNNPNLPDGFITDHFSTDKDAVEGYIVTSQVVFERLLENNVTLLRAFEASKGIVTADSTLPTPAPRNPTEAQPIPLEVVQANAQAQSNASANAQLFQEFLAWKQSQTSGS